VIRLALREALVAALERRLESGWLFLSRESLTLDSPCVLVDESDPELDARGRPLAAVIAGFEREGLSNDELADVAEGARMLEDPPPAELLLEAFEYYLEYDAFLPSRGAKPPSWEEAQLDSDREFYDRLGPEDLNERCRESGCSRGAVRFSAHCRKHHFEAIEGRKCPFE
jgi:hypothetical protein